MSSIQIPNLPAVIGLDGLELFEGVQAGLSVKISLNQIILAIVSSTPTVLPIPVSLGGTGLSTFTIGDIMYASATQTFSKLSDIALGNAIISGGVGAAPSYGKIGLTTHVSGVLPVASGGTNQSAALTQYGVIYGNTATSMASSLAGTATTVLHGNASGAPTFGAVSLTADVSGNLPVTNLNSGTSATSSTFWRGDGSWAAPTGSGNVSGPASSTDNAIARFDLTTGTLIQNSLVTIADDGAITAPQVGSIIPFYFNNQAAFPSASTYHGALAHSHSDGAMYFAHGAVWIRLLDTGGPLGTPSSGTVTNLTGTASIDINGTVGATTPTTGAFTVLTASSDSTFSSTGAVIVSKGSTGQRPGTPISGMFRFNTTTSEFEGYNGTAFTSVGGGAALSNDIITASNLFPLFASATSGLASSLFTSNAQYLFKPSTGELSVKAPRGSNGIMVNSATVADNYTIATGDNAMSAGPLTINSGVVITISSGSVWTIV